jgi:hypothetical protein
MRIMDAGIGYSCLMRCSGGLPAREAALFQSYGSACPSGQTHYLLFVKG